jgi:hypothetical protein
VTLSAFENDGERVFDIGGLAALDDAAYDERSNQCNGRCAATAAPQAPVFSPTRVLRIRTVAHVSWRRRSGRPSKHATTRGG